MDERTEAQKLADLDVLQRVRKGLQLLEEKYGPDWTDLFTDEDLQKLSLSSGCFCVLGTIHNHRQAETDPAYAERRFWTHEGYLREREIMGINYLDAIDCAFMAKEAEWEDLTVAWRQSITMLKKAKGMMR